METSGTRVLTSQLAEDLGWLEQHCRSQPGQVRLAVTLRLAAALVRNCLGPYLDDQPASPLHVAVVGGAGAGKSTVANFLSGSTIAESNPQAGFTRHPIAYAGPAAPAGWSGSLGFLGPLERLAQPASSNLDADVYQVRRVPSDPSADGLLKEFIIWDCPDMTTWAASGYVPRLLEIAGLADVVVYVASDERYNDEVPTEFLRMLLQAGKPVVCCLMKMKEEDAPALLSHFRQEVLGKMPPGTVACLTVPYLTPSQLEEPARLAGKYRIPLLNQVAVLGEPAASARRRTARGAANFLAASLDQLLAAVRLDLSAMQSWRAIVQQGQLEFEQRYRREFLSAEKFPRFDQALVRLLDLLELPGVGKVVSTTLWVLRTPFRLLKEFAGKALARPEPPGPPEQPVLESALSGWLDLLHKEVVRRGDSHPLWAHIEHGFSGDLPEQAKTRFMQLFREFQLGLTQEVDKTAREIYEDLERNPAKLNILRGGKFAVEVTAIGATAVAGGMNWHDIILVPLVASVTHWLVELMGKQYVDTHRELARQRQQSLLAHQLAGPMAAWLTNWPATGGSSFERLQLLLRRLPHAVQHVEAEVARKCGG